MSLIAPIILKLKKSLSYNIFRLNIYLKMLFYKLLFIFKIGGAMNFLSIQVAWEGKVFFPAQKIPIP